MVQKILVVDDEVSVTDLISYNLEKAHYDVLVAHDGEAALASAHEHKPDLILLDLMLPKIDGLDVCRELRKTSQVPIIMVTARGEETDRVIGLELGADDYLCKPFSMRELLARIKAVLRRNQNADQQSPAAAILKGPAGLVLDEDSRTVAINEIPLVLTRLEFDLIQHLVLNPGRVLSREQLLSQAWGYDFVGGVRAVDSAVKRLRKKIQLINPSLTLIETVRGIGYRMAR
ncbi:MAG: response regulator transcription factor [Anaerolineales bacterium]|nr:response regulator transcription factor [Anaerolineales bacterium]